VVGSQSKDNTGDPTGVATLGSAELRRSIYVQVRRTMPAGVMETFDVPPDAFARARRKLPGAVIEG